MAMHTIEQPAVYGQNLTILYPYQLSTSPEILEK